MATANDFAFTEFNKLTEGKPAGLLIFLAQQLIANASWQMNKFDNPLEADADGILTEIKQLRAAMKAASAARAKASVE